MEFEHYIQQGQQKLRCGYTTGTCAALVFGYFASLVFDSKMKK